MKRVRKAERGILLLIAMVFIVVLTLLGSMVLRQVAADVQVAGAERNSEDALYIAEAGLQWGRDELIDQFPNGSGGASFANVLSGLTAISSTDPDVKLRGWLELGKKSYNGGTYRVAVKDDDISDASGSGNNTIRMRSMGVSAGGAKRLLEVAVVQP